MAALLLLSAAAALAHPHLSKTVTAKLDNGTELKLSYYTSPANMDHVAKAQAGEFKPAAARIEVSADLDAAGVMIAAGEYTLGAIKNGDDDWSMALYPGRLGYGASPDASKLIQLKSQLSKDHGTAHHIVYDLVPGSGDQEGHLTLIWHFGSLHLSGVLN